MVSRIYTAPVLTLPAQLNVQKRPWVSSSTPPSTVGLIPLMDTDALVQSSPPSGPLMLGEGEAAQSAPDTPASPPSQEE